MSDKAKKSRLWHRLRLAFRCFRFIVWSAILLLLGAFLYFNQVGVPSVVKNPILAALRDQGIDLQFSRLRFRWIEGLVAENVRFGGADRPTGPSLTSQELQVKLNHDSLARLQLQVDSLRLKQGTLVWPIIETNREPRRLVLQNISSYIRLFPDNRWEVDGFNADFAGVRFQVSGRMTNAYHVREWPFLRPDATKTPSRGPSPSWLSHLAETLGRITFSLPPDLKLDFSGDARDISTLRLHLSLIATNVVSPWCTLEQGHLDARLIPADQRHLARAELLLNAAAVHTEWASATNFSLHLQLAQHAGTSNLFDGILRLQSQQAHTRWCETATTELAAEWVQSISKPIPLSGRATLTSAHPQTRWGNAGRFTLDARFHHDTQNKITLTPTDALGIWARFQPFDIEWRSTLVDLQAQEVETDDLIFSGSWRFPSLVLSNLQSRLYQGRVQAQAGLNVDSRKLSAQVASELDPHKVGLLLPAAANKWLSQFTWDSPPHAEGVASVTLPAWTNRAPDWRTEVLPTLCLNGSFNLRSNGTYRLVPVSAASSHFSYSNMCWHLPNLRLARPEGHVEAEHHADERTHDFYWRFHSTVDPIIVRHLLSPNVQRAFDLVSLGHPPDLEAEVFGRSRVPELTSVRARVALTNCSFRNQSASAVTARLDYTNGLLRVFDPRIYRGNEIATADGLSADFALEKVFLTNGFSNTDPMVICRAIGEQVARVTEPYHFAIPPTARVSGIIPMRGEADADLLVDLEGREFSWWKFHIPRIAGQIHWKGKQVVLRDIQATFYEGLATGYATFDFRPGSGADFYFGASVTNSLMQQLMADLSTATNGVEGRLSGAVAITKANTEDWRTTQGYGRADLENGLIWDIPLFSIFTPVLNSISPGLGNSRATSATCNFSITNGVVYSNDLEMRSPQFRLQYRGWVDLESNLEARVEAELFRDVWVLGPLVSTVFWPVTKLFEYRVSGSLEAPKSEPVTVMPKLMRMPLRPFRTLKGLFLDEPGSSQTNVTSSPR